ncbi:hypothetical protein [Novipirellula aureliae]|uniref:hypothetical protein n=1 Tax=Novipirellula aureliae TaxID=2527966 RepID=UPI001E48282E|nr:hypothetical protein [Novipirellula aureliae]
MTLFSSDSSNPGASQPSCCCCSSSKSSCQTNVEPTEVPTEVPTEIPTEMVVASELSDQSERLTRWVCLEDAAKCRGINAIWTMLAAAIVQVSPPVVAEVEPLLLFQLSVDDERACSSNPLPDPPIP